MALVTPIGANPGARGCLRTTLVNAVLCTMFTRRVNMEVRVIKMPVTHNRADVFRVVRAPGLRLGRPEPDSSGARSAEFGSRALR